MLSPEYLEHVADETVSLAEVIELQCLVILTRYFIRVMNEKKHRDDDDYDSFEDEMAAWPEFLSEIKQESDKSAKRIFKLEQKSVKTAMESAINKVNSENAKFFKDKGKDTGGIEVDAKKIPREVYTETLNTLKKFTIDSAGTDAQKQFSTIIARQKVPTDDTIYRDLMAMQTAFVNTVPNTERITRSGVNQATSQMSIAQMKRVGWDIVLVSAHIGARTGDGGQNWGNHSWWHGKFYSLTGKEFPNFYRTTGYGSIEGLCGINCRHSFGPGDGVNNPYSEFSSPEVQAENERAYLLSQRQRLLERRIRKSTREKLILSTAIQETNSDSLKEQLKTKYLMKSSTLARQKREYDDFCTSNDLIPRVVSG